MRRTKGSVKLLRAPGSQAVKAQRCGVSQGTISKWISGQKPPTYENRKTLRAQFGIEHADWDVAADASDLGEEGGSMRESRESLQG
jgi:transcriptional regulator with XRE-family HTH domain